MHSLKKTEIIMKTMSMNTRTKEKTEKTNTMIIND